MVDVDVIKRLVELMVEKDLAEISIRNGEDQIFLKRTHPTQVAVTHVPIAAAPAPLASGAASATSAAKAEEDPDAGLVAVRSPMVGTFYSAPDPASPPYVKVGDTVHPDTVVCILEAMKVFNEIKAGVSGRIERVLVPSEAAVEYDQPLLLVRPT
ncbi:MAG: acetyl-CoA carboxylase biotin carboxyl carrier protein [Planctomycetota bacterium]